MLDPVPDTSVAQRRTDRDGRPSASPLIQYRKTPFSLGVPPFPPIRSGHATGETTPKHSGMSPETFPFFYWRGRCAAPILAHASWFGLVELVGCRHEAAPAPPAVGSRRPRDRVTPPAHGDVESSTSFERTTLRGRSFFRDGVKVSAEPTDRQTDERSGRVARWLPPFLPRRHRDGVFRRRSSVGRASAL